MSRLSSYSNLPGNRESRSISAGTTIITPLAGGHSNTQLSTTTLLNALYNSYTTQTPYLLESSTSLCVSTWLTASGPSIDGRPAGPVDADIGRGAWEHARRRAEDSCIILGYVMILGSLTREMY
jgi:hypothetical protein